MWKQLDDFEHSEAAEREVIESIVENTVNKHRIEATDITVKVPDMLLRECAEEIRRVSQVHIDRTESRLTTLPKNIFLSQLLIFDI